MKFRGVILVALVAGGCAVGPGYHPVAVAPESTKVGSARPSDSTAAFFDSLAAARTRDTAARPSPAYHPVTQQALADLAWLDILRDTTLVRLVETALRQNKDLAVAQARINEFRAQARASRSGLFPRVTANGSASTNQSAFGTQVIPFDAFRVTGDVAWELDFWGRIRRGVQAANADLAAQQAAERATVLSLISDVATGYLQLVELDQEHDIATRTLASRQQTLDLANQRFQRGVISELDVRQFEALVALAGVRMAQVERQRAQQEHALNVLLGEAPVAVPRGGSLSAAAQAVAPPDSLSASLLARRPDVLQADREYAAATARIGAAQAARLPTISITGSYGSQSPSLSNLFSSSTEVSQLLGGISIPLFTGGRLENEAAAARARADQARARYERTVLTAFREAGDALVAARASRDEVAASETQARALRAAVQLAELRYQTGVSGYLEVLDVQRNLFDAELALSQAQLRQLTSAVQLYKALGGGWTETTTGPR